MHVKHAKPTWLKIVPHQNTLYCLRKHVHLLDAWGLSLGITQIPHLEQTPLLAQIHPFLTPILTNPQPPNPPC